MPGWAELGLDELGGAMRRQYHAAIIATPRRAGLHCAVPVPCSAVPCRAVQSRGVVKLRCACDVPAQQRRMTGCAKQERRISRKSSNRRYAALVLPPEDTPLLEAARPR